MATINLLKLYQSTFGYVASPFKNGNVIANVPEASKFNSLAYPEYEIFRQSYLGTPFFMPTTIDNYQLPNEPIIEISGNKTIIQTAIDGMDGSFKELFSLDDYVITIKGIAVDDNNPDMYPEEQIRAIRDLYEAKTNLQIVNRLCGFFNVKYLVVKSVSFPAIEGSRDMQPYILNCISDSVFNLELKEEI